MKRPASFLCVAGVLTLLLFTACAIPPGTAGPALSGEELYREKCSFCHRPFPPESRSPEEWEDILDEMGPEAGLSADEHAKILEFLVERSGG